jgi:hypothetical protein
MNVRGFHGPSGYGKVFIRPLRNTAVDQDIQFTGLKKMTGTRNRFFSPKMGNLKNIGSLSCCYVFLLKKLEMLLSPPILIMFFLVSRLISIVKNRPCAGIFLVHSLIKHFVVPERKFHFSLYQRGRVRVGVNDISGLSFPPPAPPSGRGVFVQALCTFFLRSAA